MRFAALGDSITYGMGDPMPAGGWRGWAALLAQSIGSAPGEVEFRNFATSGAQSRHVMNDQLPQVLEWKADLATVLVGINNTLRSSFDIKAIGAHMNRIFEELRDAGTTIVTVCLPEPGKMLRLPKSLGDPLNRRIRAVNEIVHVLSEKYSVVHAHAARHPHVMERRMWSIDRLHPSESGHRLLANLCCEALVAHGLPVYETTSLEPTSPAPTKWAQTRWMATKGTRWVVRRSIDLLPQLLMLAASEWRHSRLGLSAKLDTAMQEDIDATLDALGLLSPQSRQPGAA